MPEAENVADPKKKKKKINKFKTNSSPLTTNDGFFLIILVFSISLYTPT